MNYILPAGKYRSRGELFFAQWLEKHGISYSYEPETFKLGDDLYLPDFILPEGNVIIEVKPMVFLEETWKLRLLAELLLLRGIQFEAWIVDIRNKEPFPLRCATISSEYWEPPYNPCVRWEESEHWAECGDCHKPRASTSDWMFCPYCKGDTF